MNTSQSVNGKGLSQYIDAARSFRMSSYASVNFCLRGKRLSPGTKDHRLVHFHLYSTMGLAGDRIHRRANYVEGKETCIRERMLGDDLPRHLRLPTTVKRPRRLPLRHQPRRRTETIPTKSVSRLSFDIFDCLTGDAATKNALIRPAQYQPITAHSVVVVLLHQTL